MRVTRVSLRGARWDEPSFGCRWRIALVAASEDEEEFRAQDYPRDSTNLWRLRSRWLRALIGDVLVASAGVGVLALPSTWEPE